MKDKRSLFMDTEGLEKPFYGLLYCIRYEAQGKLHWQLHHQELLLYYSQEVEHHIPDLKSLWKFLRIQCVV